MTHMDFEVSRIPDGAGGGDGAGLWQLKPVRAWDPRIRGLGFRVPGLGV